MELNYKEIILKWKSLSSQLIRDLQDKNLDSITIKSLENLLIDLDSNRKDSIFWKLLKDVDDSYDYISFNMSLACKISEKQLELGMGNTGILVYFDINYGELLDWKSGTHDFTVSELHKINKFLKLNK